MVHHTNHSNKPIARVSPLLAAGAFVISAILAPVIVQADQYDQMIRERQQKQAQAQGQANQLGAQANDVQGQINELQSQIASIQAQIDTNTAKQNELARQIEAAQKKLEEQKDLLSANIRSMYIEGDITPLEMIASSKNLGDFVDKQEYRDRIKDNISSTMDEIERLKKQLDDQKKEVTRIIEEQKELRGGLDQKNAEAGAKLSALNKDKATFDGQVATLSKEIANLRAQQIAANSRFIGGSAGTGQNCGGGYPGHAPGGIRGRWGCNYALNDGSDNWGMYNRQCVSYAAFKVAQSGRNMPFWGGRGNANQWPANARAAGIPVDGNPRVGDVAVSMAGYYGHVMYVEAVLGGGKIKISQYNAAWDGRWSEAVINAAGLQFIHFP
jgi:peptidoglycan hydrolase CwlO-like protein